MNKRELVRSVANSTGKPITTVEVIIQAAFDQITDALDRGDIISIGGFGSFALGGKKTPAKKTPK
jgi:DNA-binding protein HU-beta